MRYGSGVELWETKLPFKLHWTVNTVIAAAQSKSNECIWVTIITVVAEQLNGPVLLSSSNLADLVFLFYFCASIMCQKAT